ncbi:MAG TPA: transferrin receptor-like dimerization domain-containing protein [Gemmatimonadales bacterium]|jgi:N-acetylated-alpha-linked acidic dipeptidase
MTRSATILALAFVLLAFDPRPADDGPMLGFSAARVAEQAALETQFASHLSRDTLERWLKQMSSAPNHVGAPHTKANAEWMASRFRTWGYETRIDEYQVLFPTPTVRVLEMVAPRRFRARLAEPTLAEDATSRITDGRLPPYNAYSADGDVTGELVYVNYGIPDDYEELERRGIDVAGKIVIARYGGSWRGIKPKVAAEHGAIGCIIYSDPRDDGYYQGDVYPKGAWRMAYGAQRGSVADMPTYPGDPLTPFVGATRDAERMTVQGSPTVMKIPVLPLSYADAQPLLEALDGPVAPAAWRGALPITYHLGPGPARVHLRVAFDWSLRPAYDVIATLHGSQYPDQWILRGNHHDAWVFGAADPLSGMVSLLEEARAVGELARQGWRPRRTIVYAAWDAEEPGLLGSTEWAEHHADELRQKAAVYINTDGNGRGFLGVGGSHALERFVNQVARDVADPETGASVLERSRALAAVRDDVGASLPDVPIYPLGSGSDYTPFLQHLTIASLNVGYGGESGGGSYHSIFDSFDHYARFGDIGFAYGATLAETTGRMTLRLAQADVLPFRFTNLVTHVQKYVEEIAALADRMRSEAVRRNERLDRRQYELAGDPRERYAPPARLDPVPHVNFAPLRNALVELEAVAERYDAALERRMAGDGVAVAEAARINALLVATERALGDADGLPRRPWFRHSIYAPGFYTGYGVKTLPGVREAIEQRAWEDVDPQMRRIAAALGRLADTLTQAAAILE